MTDVETGFVGNGGDGAVGDAGKDGELADDHGEIAVKLKIG